MAKFNIREQDPQKYSAVKAEQEKIKRGLYLKPVKDSVLMELTSSDGRTKEASDIPFMPKPLMSFAIKRNR